MYILPIMRKYFATHTKGILLFLAIACSPVFVLAQTQTERFVPGVTLEGINYYLPRTAMRVVIRAEKKVVTPGEFHMYAFKYMRLQDIPVQSTTTWTVKDIQVLPYGVPDKEKAYSIKLKSRTVAPFVSLSKEGLILGINTEGEKEETIPAVPKARILEHAITHSEVRRYMNREMLQAGSTAKMAELAAREIYDIRESRDALVRGEADNTPKDGAQLKLMLDNLDAQQRALLSLFSGTTEISEVYYAMDVIPTAETNKMILFRFSKWMGLVDADDMSGVPFYMSIGRMGDLPPRSEDAAVEQKKGKMQKAVYYNMPARTKVKIFDAGNVWTETEIPMAQLGYTEILSNVLFDKTASTRVSFYQSTGGIRNIISNKEGK